MKLTVDLNDPADVQAALAVLQGHGEASAAPAAPTPPAPAPVAPAPVAPAPAAPAPAPAPAAPAPAATAPAAPAPAAPAPAAPPAAPAPVAPAPAAAATTSPEGYTMAQVTTAIQAYAKQHKTAAAKAVLAELGVEKASDLDPSQYALALQKFAV